MPVSIITRSHSFTPHSLPSPLASSADNYSRSLQRTHSIAHSGSPHIGISLRPPIITRGAIKRQQQLAPDPITLHVQEVRARMSALLPQLRAGFEAIKTAAAHPTDPQAIAARDSALAFFSTLPKVGPSTSVEDLVKMGMIGKIPKGWERMSQTGRYVLGRQIIVRTQVNPVFQPAKQFLTYKADGPTALTYRATLAGENGDNFLVKLDGQREPIEMPKAEVARYNQPQVFNQDAFTLSGVKINYDEPCLKAKIHAGFAQLFELINELDFDSAFETLPNGSVEIHTSGPLLDQQRKAVRIIHDLINMTYGGSSYNDAGRMAVQSSGVCYQQSAVMAAMLAPYAQLLGLDVQLIDGKIFRTGWKPGAPGAYGDHGWVMITFRPGMSMRVTDRTWQQPSIEIDRAYSRVGDRYPLKLVGVNYRDESQLPLTPEQITLRKNLVVTKHQRIFGQPGIDGRDNHQSTGKPIVD